MGTITTSFLKEHEKKKKVQNAHLIFPRSTPSVSPVKVVNETDQHKASKVIVQTLKLPLQVKREHIPSSKPIHESKDPCWK